MLTQYAAKFLFAIANQRFSVHCMQGRMEVGWGVDHPKLECYRNL